MAFSCLHRYISKSAEHFLWMLSGLEDPALQLLLAIWVFEIVLL